MTGFPLVKADFGWYARSVTPLRSSPAVIFRWRAYGESDKIVTFLTRDFGKLTGIAKGARRSRRRFVNSLEPLARVQIHFRQRPVSSLAFLESSDLLHPPGDLTEPVRFAYASYLAELTDQFTGEEEPVPELYALLDEALSVLAARPACGAFLRAFEIRLLSRAGYEPQFDQCSACRRALPTHQPSFLDLRQGTILCAKCAAATPTPSLEEASSGVLGHLAALKHVALAACSPELIEGFGTEAASINGRLLAPHLTRPLKSLKFIAQATAAGRGKDGEVVGEGSAVMGPGDRTTQGPT
jgi:DNA repair protein RecO (recombination protein O)